MGSLVAFTFGRLLRSAILFPLEKGNLCVLVFLFLLTWPMAKLEKLFGITYLVGKISR